MPFTSWRKSSFSQSEGSDCVEVAWARGECDAVAVRDSKHVTGPMLVFPVSAWRGLRDMKAAEQRPTS